MVKFLNFCCHIAYLPKKFKAAVANLIIALLVGAFALAALDSIEATGYFEAFWKFKAAAWVIYFSIISFMIWRIRAKWHDGTFHIDENS